MFSGSNQIQINQKEKNVDVFHGKKGGKEERKEGTEGGREGGRVRGRERGPKCQLWECSHKSFTKTHICCSLKSNVLHFLKGFLI